MMSRMIPACWQPIQTTAVSAIGLLVSLALVAPITAFAAPEISGSPDAVSIDAQHSSIKEILSGLRERFDVQFQSTANLDTPLTGTYQGPLRQIVARLLAGYNFVITTKQGGIEVTVLGNAPSTSTTTTASNAPGSSQGPTLPGQSAQLAPAASASPPATAQEQQPVAGDQSSSPMPLMKVAEGPPVVPTPVLTPSSVSGPVPGPATTSMPEPKPSGEMPMPTPSTASMPSGNTIAPGSSGSTNPPSITPPAPATPATPAPQKP